jgi:hypothetical protein
MTFAARLFETDQARHFLKSFQSRFGKQSGQSSKPLHTTL